MSVEAEVQELAPEEAEVIELTQREIAIARGEDPDESPETVVEEESLAEEPVVDEPQAEAAVEDVPSISDEIIGKAKVFGLSDDDIKNFGNERSLQLHVQLLEKIESLAGASKPVDDDAAEAEAETDAPIIGDSASDDLIDLSIYDGTADGMDESEAWDERSLAIPKALRREQELRIETQKQLEGVLNEVKRLSAYEAEREQQRISDNFHTAVDQLGDRSLGSSRDEYGRPVRLTEAQIKLREKLFEEVDTLAGTLQEKAKRNGQSFDLSWEEAVEKARVTAFGAPKSSDKTRSEALKKQSAQRRPVSTSAAANRRVASDDSPESIANSPEIVAFWERAQQANGV
jgi:hypothetical protein